MAQLKMGSTVGGKNIAVQDDVDLLSSLVESKANVEDVALRKVVGGTFYVNPSTGNDLNPGTSGAPWRTLGGVAAHFNDSINTSIVTIVMSGGDVAPSTVSFRNIIANYPFYFVGTNLEFTDPNYESEVPVTSNIILLYNCFGAHGSGNYPSSGPGSGFGGSSTSGVFHFLGCKFKNTAHVRNSNVCFNKCLFKGINAGGNSNIGIGLMYNSTVTVYGSCQFEGFSSQVFDIRNSTIYIGSCTGSSNNIGVRALEGGIAINLSTLTIGAVTPNYLAGGIIFKSSNVFE